MLIIEIYEMYLQFYRMLTNLLLKLANRHTMSHCVQVATLTFPSELVIKQQVE